MGPAEMADLYSQTRLNVHPCTYDAYGMTIVEAASQVGRKKSIVICSDARPLPVGGAIDRAEG